MPGPKLSSVGYILRANAPATRVERFHESGPVIGGSFLGDVVRVRPGRRRLDPGVERKSLFLRHGPGEPVLGDVQEPREADFREEVERVAAGREELVRFERVPVVRDGGR